MIPEKDTGADGDSAYKKDFRTALPQFLAVSVKNLLLLGYGMTLGFPTILIPAVSSPMDGEVLHPEKSEISWISSINYIMVPVGCALSGLVTTPLGRRRAMQVVNVPFFLAWLLFHFASSTPHLYAALFLTGLAGGLLEAPVLTYVAEITQPHLRGLLSATSSMSIILGVFTQFLFGLMLKWRDIALINIIFTILAVIALFFVPESPHWLVSKKRIKEARKSLQWLRGWTTPEAVEDELREIENIFKTDKVKAGAPQETFAQGVSHYFKKSFLVPYFLVCFSFFVGHFSGMTTLQTYAVSIFQMLEAPIDKYYATMILGILQMVGTGVCVLLVHFTGKRPLSIVSTAGAAICCLLVAGYDFYIVKYGIEAVPMNSTDLDTNVTIAAKLTSEIANEIHSGVMKNPYSWMPTTLLMLLAFITHTGIRLLPWILIGEIFNSKTRAGGAGLASAVGYIFGFLVNKMYIVMVDTMSIWGTYGLYGVICAVGAVTLYFILPETEGKKLNEIENHFAGIRRLTNEVYRSKKRPKADISRMQDLKGATNLSYEDDK